MNEAEAIVTCKDIDNPNFQVWGALSDLGCKTKKPRTINFKSWLKNKESKNKKSKK